MNLRPGGGPLRVLLLGATGTLGGPGAALTPRDMGKRLFALLGRCDTDATLDRGEQAVF